MNNLNLVDIASRDHVLGATQAFAGKHPSQWLGAAHNLGKGHQEPDWNVVQHLPNAEFAASIAASGPQHCVDGWSYAARAIGALVAGDHHAARHLAYYAQLRAGLSMLAALGVGVFDGLNFVVDAAGQFHSFERKADGTLSKRGTGTHSAVWEILQAWAASPTRAVDFLKLIRPRGYSLDETIGSIWPGYDAAALATNLVAAWGLDLSKGAQDKIQRNISSYSAQVFNPIGEPARGAGEFISNVWDLFSPSGGSGFDNLDKYLVRRLLRQQHALVDGDIGTIGQGPVDRRFDELPLAIQTLAPKEFLLSDAIPTPKVIASAWSTSAPALASEMIGRALLLLRVATGFTHSNMADAGIRCSEDHLRPWLDEFGANRGFWPVAQPVESMDELWLDVELALIDLDASLDAANGDLYGWTMTERGLPTVTQTERIALWGLCA